MSNLEHIDRNLKQQALERYHRFTRTPLARLMTLSPAFQSVGEDHLHFLASHKAGIRQWFHQNAGPQPPKHTLNFFASRTLDYLYLHNQYLDVPERSQQKLQAIYAQLIQRYQEAVCDVKNAEVLRQALHTILADHQTHLANFIDALGAHNGGLDFVLGEPVCSQYSPAFQIALLVLPVHQLQNPILDLGCGQKAQLVNFLNNAGKEAYGVDRSAGETQNVYRQDWFEFPLESNQWGTIISQMAFSVHFLHHHLRHNGHPEKYARQYMAILRSLKTGGQFIYTPGLPFIEPLLPPDQYHVQRFAIDQHSLFPQSAESMAGNAGYTAVITRY